VGDAAIIVTGMEPEYEGMIESRSGDSFELRRLLVDQSVPPDEMMYIRHESVVQPALTYPALDFAREADCLNRPLMETTMGLLDVANKWRNGAKQWLIPDWKYRTSWKRSAC